MSEKVSIIIPVYNSEKYLVKSIDSCINQTYNDIEILVIVRPGLDHSLDILKKYSQKIRIIIKPNIKQFEAFNLGIQEMNGEWFKFMSSDDILYQNAIEELIVETKKFPNNKKIIYYSNFDIINSKDEITRDIICPDDSKHTAFEQNVRLLDGFYGNPNTSLIHKEELKKYGSFNESIEFVADYELWLRLCMSHDFRLHLIPKKLLKCRIHEDSVTSNFVNNKQNKEVQKLALRKLDKNQQKKYVVALKKYQHKSIKTRVKGATVQYLLNYLPKSFSKRVSKY